MTILIIGIAVVGIALGAAGAVWAQDYWRQRKAQRELKPILDWRPDARIDASVHSRGRVVRGHTFRPTGRCRPRRSGWSRASAATRMSRSATASGNSP